MENKLTISKAFHRLLYPMPNVHRIAEDNLQDRERVRRKEWRASHLARYELFAARLKETGICAPFKTWINPSNGKHIIVDGRHYEYSAALRLGVEITEIVISCADEDHAQSYMIADYLTNAGRPLHGDYYRIQLAAQCKYIIDFKKLATSNRGRRTDLLAQAPNSSPRDTRKQIALLAGCGATTVRKALSLGQYGELYFPQQRWIDIHNALIVGDMAISQAFRKLKGEMDVALKAAMREQDSLDDVSTYDDTEEVEQDAEQDDELGDGKESEHDQKKKAHAKQSLEAQNTLAQKKRENIAKILSSIPFDNPNLDTIDWTKANKIISGINSEMMEFMPDGFATLVFGSPPYPVDKEYEGANYKQPIHDWLENEIAPVVKQAARVLREGGRLIIQCSDCFEIDNGTRSSVHLPVLAEVINFIASLDLGFMYRETKVWLKFVRPARAPIGSIGSPSNPKSYNSHEWLIVFSLRTNTLAAPGDVESGMTSDFYRQVSTGVWYYAPVSTNKMNHPCPFPEPIAENVIKLYSYPTDLVIDPWSGTGTTPAMAARHGRRWIGIDCEESYCKGAYIRCMQEGPKRRKKLRAVLDSDIVDMEAGESLCK